MLGKGTALIFCFLVALLTIPLIARSDTDERLLDRKLLGLYEAQQNPQGPRPTHTDFGSNANEQATNLQKLVELHRLNGFIRDSLSNLQDLKGPERDRRANEILRGLLENTPTPAMQELRAEMQKQALAPFSPMARLLERERTPPPGTPRTVAQGYGDRLRQNFLSQLDPPASPTILATPINSRFTPPKALPKAIPVVTNPGPEEEFKGTACSFHCWQGKIGSFDDQCRFGKHCPVAAGMACGGAVELSKMKTYYAPCIAKGERLPDSARTWEIWDGARLKQLAPITESEKLRQEQIAWTNSPQGKEVMRREAHALDEKRAAEGSGGIWSGKRARAPGPARAVVKQWEGVGFGARDAKVFLDGLEKISRFSGGGVSGSAYAGFGVGAFMEAIRFDDNSLQAYCGPLGVVSPGVDINASVYAVRLSESCTPQNYTGKFLNFGVGINTPEVKVGFAGTYSFGVDHEQLARKMAGFMTKHILPDVAALENQGNVLVKAFGEVKGGQLNGPAQQAMLASILQMSEKFVAALKVGVQVGAPAQLAKIVLPELTKAVLKGARPIDSRAVLAGVMESLKKVTGDRNSTREEKAAARFLNDVVDVIHGSLSGCDSMGVGAGIGLQVEPSPVSASVSLSYAAPLGKLSGPSLPHRDTVNAGFRVVGDAAMVLPGIQAGHGPLVVGRSLASMTDFANQAQKDQGMRGNMETLETLNRMRNVMGSGGIPGVDRLQSLVPGFEFTSQCIYPALRDACTVARILRENTPPGVAARLDIGIAPNGIDGLCNGLDQVFAR